MRHRAVGGARCCWWCGGGRGARACGSATRTHHGTGKLAVKAPSSSRRRRPPAQVGCAGAARSAYNPLGSRTDEHPTPASGDRQPAQHRLEHPDLLRRHAQQGGRRAVHRRQARRPAARVLRIITTTPGFTATVYGRNNQPPLTLARPRLEQDLRADQRRPQARHPADRPAPSTATTWCGSRALGEPLTSWRSTRSSRCTAQCSEPWRARRRAARGPAPPAGPAAPRRGLPLASNSARTRWWR